MQQRLLPPHLFLLCLGIAGALDWLLPIRTLWPMPWNLLGLLPVAVGVTFLVLGSKQFSVAETNINTFLAPTHLVTDGVFRLSRNPMYLGFSITLLGICTLLANVGPFFAPLAFIFIASYWYIPFEERACDAIFGDSYRRYCNSVRRWL